jgi:hypothetical protein
MTSDNQINSVTSASDEGQTAVHFGRRYRDLGIFCLVIFVLAGIGSAYVTWIEAVPELRIYGVVLVSLFWGTLSCFPLWTLLSYWLGSLTIRDGTVAQQGVISRNEVDLRDVGQGHWRLDNSIKLRTPTARLTIDFNSLEPSERLSLIRHFRSELPEDVQRGWDLFCSKIALPLRDHNSGNRHAGPDEVHLTRRRWDWWFIPAILVFAVCGIVIYWLFQQPRMLAIPLLPALMWLFLRFGTPKDGFISKRISAHPELKQLLVLEARWGGVALAGFVVFKVANPPHPEGTIMAIIAVVLGFGGFFLQIRPLDRQMGQRNREAAKAATEEWDMGEDQPRE